jgi:hypothetical protein
VWNAKIVIDAGYRKRDRECLTWQKVVGVPRCSIRWDAKRMLAVLRMKRGRGVRIAGVGVPPK